MADGNPFGPAPPAPSAPGTGGYPFDSMSSQASIGGQQYPYSAPPQQPMASQSFAQQAQSQTDNPFVAVSPTPYQSYGVPSPSLQSSVDPYGHSQQLQTNYTPSGYPVASMTSASTANPNLYQADSIVVSQYQSNPYAGLVSPLEQSSQWASASSKTFDPFAPPPPPAPEPPVQAPAPQYGGQVDMYGQPLQQDPFGSSNPPPSYPEDEDPLAAFGGSPQVEAPVQEKSPPPPLSEQRSRDGERDINESSRVYGPPPDQPVDPPTTLVPQSYDFGQRSPDSSTPAPNERTLSTNIRNPYREDLARRAPPGASPLPKADLVRKRGYVLSRISFRTIVMKKWKQSYWVQYGPHTMLWFRSESDFMDWLNNPYHDQAQRNFLIKLAVNFVHDLYKPNVRGYQVTQCRTKAYGNKMVRQFKLERWMDYGPTIAAAFGSYNPKEVDDLREALVECMRNTPLNSGIRATGAVRQRPQQQLEGDHNDHHRQDDHGNDDRERRHHEERLEQGGGSERPHDQQNGNVPASGDSVAEESDLLDVENWDDVPNAGGGLDTSMSGVYSQPTPGGYAPSPYGAPPPGGAQQQQPYPPQQAVVPVAVPQAYPGAPPLQQPMFGQPQQMQPQPGYAGMPPQQDPWGAQQPTGIAPAQQYAPYPGQPQQQPYAAAPQQQYPQQHYQQPSGY